MSYVLKFNLPQAKKRDLLLKIGQNYHLVAFLNKITVGKGKDVGERS